MLKSSTLNDRLCDNVFISEGNPDIISRFCGLIFVGFFVFFNVDFLVN